MSLEILATRRAAGILAVASIATMACIPQLVAQDKRTGNNPEKSEHAASGPRESKGERGTKPDERNATESKGNKTANSKAERATDSTEGRTVERRDGRAPEVDSKDQRVTKPDAGQRKATERESKPSISFNPEVRTKVGRYFDRFKANRHGLPPEWVSRMRVREIPANWRSRILPGIVIVENERIYLIEAPQDLVDVLPPLPAGFHYYVAGSNVVAVDDNYRIVESFQIPTIVFTD